MTEKNLNNSEQKTPRKKELPASQRKHAAQLSERARSERVSRNSSISKNSENKPVRKSTTGSVRNERSTTSTNRNSSSNHSSKKVILPKMPASSIMGSTPNKNSKNNKLDSHKNRNSKDSNKKNNSINNKKSYDKKNNSKVNSSSISEKNNKKPINNNSSKKVTTNSGNTKPATSVNSNNSSPAKKKKVITNKVGTGSVRKSVSRGSKKAQRIADKQKKAQRAIDNQNKSERKVQPLPETLVYKSGSNIQDLAKLLHRDTSEILKKMFLLGIVVNQNQSLDNDTIDLLAADYGIESEVKEQNDIADIDKFFIDEENSDNKGNLEERPPVVTIMGHVDHGKTTLLDYLRKSDITAGEAGGITQHIGAYQSKIDGKVITFLDTPGHSAFTEMRSRGADITDIIILVVAADDGIMPQTIEAINHAKAAEKPIIVAINKMDIPGVDTQNIINQLMSYDLVPEEYGGDTIMVPISAKMGTSVDKLLEMILLQAEVMNLKAQKNILARGTVIESRLDKGKGAVSTLLVQQGTLKTGDPIVVGNTYGRVRTMQDESGRTLKTAGPSTPVEITGLNAVPMSGDKFVVMESEKKARQAGIEREQRALTEERNNNSVVTLDTLFSTMADKQVKLVKVILKADVQGTIEALKNSLNKIEVDGVKVDVIHSSVGAINETDVTLAEASDAIIVGFNVRPTALAKKNAEQKKITLNTYNVIYNVIGDIEKAMKGKLDPEFKEVVNGQMEVRQLFHHSKVGTIAGGMVMDGSIKRSSKARIVRDGVVIYDGEISSIKHNKDEIKEATKGVELGLTLENFNDEKEGDIIESYDLEEVKIS